MGDGAGNDGARGSENISTGLARLLPEAFWLHERETCEVYASGRDLFA